MDLDKIIDGEVAVLRCTGRLNMSAAPGLRTAVDELVGQGASRIVIDLSDTSFVDSSGLGALVGGLKSARQAGGDLRIAGAAEQVRTVLALTNLDRVLTPHRTVADASHGW
ncbi:MAG: STAS domain-containing protein [Nocardioides sp.]